MALNNAFMPRGGGPVNITVGVASSGAQVGNDAAIQYRFVNSGTNAIFFLAAQGALPTVTTANGIQMLPNTVEVFTLPANAFIATIAAATGNTLQVTPGEGM